MNKERILEHIVPLNLLQKKPYRVEEIGDGNLNFVYRISDDAQSSLIVKYAPPYLRLLGEDFKLPQERICVEMHTMCYFESIAPSFVPHIFHCDETHFYCVMEDLKGYVLLQQKRLKEKIPLVIYEKLGTFLALLYTNTPPSFKEGFYENATLKQISENYIFVFPHIKNHEALILPPFFTPTFKSALFEENMDTLRDVFLHVKECLIHGDLHTGSLLIHENDVKVIDAEFSLFAPLGFDMGVLFAHILFGELHALMLGKQAQTQEALLSVWEHFCLHVNEVPSHIIAQSAGFCGAELYRRLVVPAKAKPLLALPSHLQAKAYQKVEALAVCLVENYLHVKQMHDMLRLLKEHEWL